MLIDTLYYVTGDEMFSDTYKMKLIDDVMYEVTGRVSALLKYLLKFPFC